MKGHPKWAIAIRLTSLGWYVAFCIVGGIIGGIALDKFLATVFVFTIIGVISGTILAFWGIYKMVQPMVYHSGNPSIKDQGAQE
ncbi:MAG: AtpZ/AtpI family protein [Chloroflexota bacterium]|nr:AtpZ/AtpI family protein [Chloroflexota bacterium]